MNADDLRYYQTGGIQLIREELRRFPRVLYQLPTGGGKTEMIGYFCKSAHERGNSVIVLAHRRFLVKQISEALTRWGVPHSLIVPGTSPTRELIQVASIDTLIRKLDKYQPPKLLICDEAHHCVRGNKWGRVVSWLFSSDETRRLLGVTATPRRLDNQGLGDCFDALVCGPTIQELIHHRFLVPVKGFFPPNGVDRSGIKRARGDFDIQELVERTNRPRITGNAIDHYRRICPGVPFVAFCCTVAHAQDVAKRFSLAGFPTVCVHGEMAEAERDRTFADLASGRIVGVAACELINEGLNIPDIGCVISLRATESTTVWLQQIGRGLRWREGKECCYLLDHAGNAYEGQLGIPGESHYHWTLERTKNKKDKGDIVSLMRCPECFAVFAPRQTCPACGHRFEAKDMPPSIEESAGELVQMTAAELQAKKEELRKRRQRAKTLHELYALAEELGYKQGWADYIYRSRHGVKRWAAEKANLKAKASDSKRLQAV